MTTTEFPTFASKQDYDQSTTTAAAGLRVQGIKFSSMFMTDANANRLF
jgi:hypothetical protein